MTYLQIPQFLDETTRDQALRIALRNQNSFDEYNNPFERKLTLPRSSSLASYFAEIVRPMLMLGPSTWWVSRLLNVPISHADWTHYGSVFIYRQNDYLKPHVDAGIHPKNGLRKIVTACLYLTRAQLNFWHGEPAYYQRPCVSYINTHLEIAAGDLVLFTNDDNAWHEVPQITGPERVCITLSYLAPSEFSNPNYTNTRTRAYFARLDSEDTSLDDLREKRASEEYHEEVYRVHS